MDETRSELGFWVALVGGLFFTYNGSVAVVTKMAHAGRGRVLRGEDAILYGWIALMVGVVLLLFALMRFLESRRS